MNASVWTGLFAPAWTPKPILAAIHRDVIDIIVLPGTRAALAKQGAEPTPTTPEAFAAFLDREIDKWAKVIRNAKIRPE